MNDRLLFAARCIEIRLDLEIYTEVSLCQPCCVFCCRHTHEWTVFYCSLCGIRLGGGSPFMSTVSKSGPIPTPVPACLACLAVCPPHVLCWINRQYTLIVQITNLVSVFLTLRSRVLFSFVSIVILINGICTALSACMHLLLWCLDVKMVML